MCDFQMHEMHDLSRRTYRQSHGTLGVLKEWPSCRSTDSVGVSYNCDKHDSDLLTHAVHSAPCSNLYIELQVSVILIID